MARLELSTVKKYENLERTGSAGEYVLVMRPAICTLYDDIHSRGVAGRNMHTVIEIFREIVQCVKMLHRLEMVHCDIKPKNVLKVECKDGSLKYILGDLGQSHKIGEIRYVLRLGHYLKTKDLTHITA